MKIRTSLTRAALLCACALWCASCGGEGQDPDAPTDTNAATNSRRQADPTGCEAGGYPCTPGEVDADARAEVTAVMQEALTRSLAGDALEDIAAELEQDARVAAIATGEDFLSVRAEGSRWFTLMTGVPADADAFAPEPPTLRRAQPLIAGHGGPHQEQRRARLISGSYWRGAAHRRIDEITTTLASIRDYQHDGGVQSFTPPHGVASPEQISELLGALSDWRRLDVIVADLPTVARAEDELVLATGLRVSAPLAEGADLTHCAGALDEELLGLAGLECVVIVHDTPQGRQAVAELAVTSAFFDAAGSTPLSHQVLVWLQEGLSPVEVEEGVRWIFIDNGDAEARMDDAVALFSRLAQGLSVVDAWYQIASSLQLGGGPENLGQDRHIREIVTLRDPTEGLPYTDGAQLEVLPDEEGRPRRVDLSVHLEGLPTSTQTGPKEERLEPRHRDVELSVVEVDAAGQVLETFQRVSLEEQDYPESEVLGDWHSRVELSIRVNRDLMPGDELRLRVVARLTRDIFGRTPGEQVDPTSTHTVRLVAAEPACQATLSIWEGPQRDESVGVWGLQVVNDVGGLAMVDREAFAGGEIAFQGYTNPPNIWAQDGASGYLYGSFRLMALGEDRHITDSQLTVTEVAPWLEGQMLTTATYRAELKSTEDTAMTPPAYNVEGTITVSWREGEGGQLEPTCPTLSELSE